jgi:ComF family protein
LPRTCALCDAALAPDEHGLCDPCVDGLPGRLATRCTCCGLALPGPPPVQPGPPAALPGPSAALAGAPPDPPRCAGCTATPPAYDRTLVLADYAPPLDRLVHALKFQGELSLAAALGRRMAPLLEHAAAGVDALVPVPLAAARIATRGFNQSAAIARSLRRSLRIPMRAGLLVRCRETPAQSTLALAARHANLEGAFLASPAAAGLRLALVDDVMTSGSTLQAAALALRAAGAKSVLNLVAARTP